MDDRVSISRARLARRRLDCQIPSLTVSSAMAQSSTAPALFDRALLARRRERARKMGPVTFLLDRVAEDFGDRLQAVMRNFADVADIATAVEWLPGPIVERFNSV